VRLDLRDPNIRPPSGKWEPRQSPREIEPTGRYAALICAHQFAVVFSTSAQQRAAAGGDVELARARRTLRTPYHVSALVATGRPQVITAWSADLYTNHAGALNRYSIGLGFEGLYPRDERQRSTRHTAPPGSAARRALEAAVPEALSACVELLREVLPSGARIGLVTHCQSSSDRGADPGELLMRLLVPAAEDLGVDLVSDLVWGSGRPWPSSWRP
jgi:hypothetical protein